MGRRITCMDTNWLQDFLALAQTRHFTQAANQRNISQAAFSRRIKALEAWLGVSLIERGTVPAFLTAEGRRFEPEAREMLARLLDARASLNNFAGSSRSILRVSMPQTIATTHFSNWWCRWGHGLNIDLETQIDNTTHVASNFISGNADLLICHQSESHPALVDHRQFMSHTIEFDTLVPVIKKRGAYTDGEDTGEGIKTAPLIMYSSHVYFSLIVRKLIEQSDIPLLGHHSIDTELAYFVANCVRNDMGLGWIPRSLLSSNYSNELIVVQQPMLSAALSIKAYAPRKQRTYACDQIWQQIVEQSASAIS